MEPAANRFNAPTSDAVDAAITRARQFSRYLERALTAEPQLLELVDLCTLYKVACTLAETAILIMRDALQRALRRLRKQAMAALIVRDLAGWATLAEVTQTMTQLAECTLSTALEWVTRDLAQGMGVLMGEFGQL